MTLTYDKIYEAVFSPELWRDVLHDLADTVNAEGALLADIGSARRPWIASKGVAELYEAFFAEGWAYDNAKTIALVTTPHQGFISDADFLTEEVMAEQAIYRDFYWKRGFGYAAGTLMKAPGANAIAISIETRRDRGPVGRRDLDLLDLFRPHLARATMLASRFAFARIDATLNALHIAGLPAAAIGDDRRVYACNGSFDIFSQQITVQSRDRLRMHDREADEFLTRVLSGRRDAGGPRDSGSYSFAIPSAGGNPPAIIHLVPVVGAGRDIFVRAAYILIAAPVDQRGRSSEALIKGLFDLTPAEARIAFCLASGLTIKQVAAQQAISPETVRSHVKSLLAKSGTKRQADFVAIVAGLRTLSIA